MHYARPSLPSDPWELAPRLRDEDAREVKLASGHTPLESLIDGFELSEQCFSIVQDRGPIVAMFGLAPAEGAPEVGVVWMLCADEVPKASVTILRQMVPFLDHFHRRYPILTNCVWEGNPLHLKWCLHAGFKALQRVENYRDSGQPFIEIARVQPHV